jgi:RND family efflux transporter MFP subunit
MPPQKTPEVVVRSPVRKNIMDYEECTGRTEAVKTVDVRARVTGYLIKWNFTQGKRVTKGDVLFEIDPRPYEAELARTDANVVQAEAHLTRLSADYQRAAGLHAKKAMGREEFDKIAGDKAEAVAAVGVAKASRDLAQLNLSFTRVLAPVTGIISRTLIDEGNLVKADDTILTTIVTQDPMYAYFDVDERTSLRLLRLLQEGSISIPPVRMGLADEGTTFPHEGMVDFIDNRIDVNTGTLHMRCSFPNPKAVLTPGLFVRIRFIFGELHQVILIPEEAIGTDQGRKFVYVVNGQDQIEYRPIKISKQHEGLRAIVEGLKGDERIVVSGIQRVRPGIKVIAKEMPKEQPPAERPA